MKTTKKRFLSFALAFLMLVGCLPAGVFTTHVHAADADLTMSSVPGLGASYTQPSNGTYSWTADGTTITGSATGYYSSSWFSSGDKPTQTTLTLKNTLSVDATLSFDWATTGNGSVSEAISGSDTASGSYEKTLAAGASVKVKLQSDKGSDKTINLQLTNVTLTPEAGSDVSLTFRSAENGSYTVNGTAITAETAMTVAANTYVTLVATANAGYKLFGWWDTAQNCWISADTTLTYVVLNETTLYPYFITDTLPVWGVGNTRFEDLDEAIECAVSGTDKTVYLAENGTLPAGNYTIPAGVTLLIPFDDDNTVLTEGTPLGTKRDLGFLGVSYSHPEADQPISTYRALIMDSGAKITVNGALNVGGKHNSNGCTCAKPVGPLGMIQMVAGSQIILNNGANLHCWGVIYGGGTVTAKSGATVHELFQFTDFRGGNATGSIAGESKVFPFSQYYVQNAEVPITYEHGAKETVWTTIHVDSLKYKVPVSVDFVGTGDSALFAPEEGGTIVKRYDPATDRLIIDVNGGGYINSMKLSLAGNNVDSADYPLPLNSNITVNVNSGTVTANQSLALLPGAKITVAKNATLEIAKASKAGTGYTGGENLFIYSRTDWLSGKFVWSGKYLASVVYSPDKAYNRTDADLVDAVLDVNGTLITDGFVYTSATISTGGIISSSGTGKVVMNNGVGQDYITWQTADNGSTYTDIVMYSAWLRNGNGTYVETANYDTGYDEDDNEILIITSTSKSNAWAYCSACDKWAPLVTIKYAANGGAGSMAEQVVTNCGCHKLTTNGFTKTDCTFDGWTASNGNSYTNQAIIDSTFDGEITLTAKWKDVPKTVVITWHVGDTTTTTQVDVGEVPSYSGSATKTPDANYHYTFAGWSLTENGSIIPLDGYDFATDTHLYAVFTPVAHADNNNDHKCDGCTYAGKLSECADNNNDHKCDTCGNTLSQCADKNKDHQCDTCGATMGEHADSNKDHKCDYGCNEAIGEHADSNKDHKCDYGCNEAIGEHADTNKDHKCDYGCNETFGEHADTDKDHVCDYGCDEAIGEHKLDHVTAVPANCKDTGTIEYWHCDYCGKNYTDAAGTNETTNLTENVNPNNHASSDYTYVDTDSAQHEKLHACCGTPAATEDHTYVNGTCVCGHKHGWVVEDSDKYYYIHNEAQKGITPIDGDLYALDNTTGALITTDGVCLHADGTFYLESGKLVANKGLVRWEYKTDGVVTDVCYYYFADTYLGYENLKASVALKESGKDIWVPDTTGTDLPVWGYFTDETGAFVHYDHTLNGIQTVNGVKYYLIDGIGAHVGMIRVGDHMYYAKSRGNLAVSESYYCTNVNDTGFDEGVYTFDEEGRMTSDITLKWDDAHEHLYCYDVNGKLTYAGLIKYTDGYYYYVRTSGEAVVGQNYWISKTNGLMGERSYEFDENGRMVNPDVKDTTKNGIVAENGSLYYYENGVLTYAGLIEIDGNYYYVKTSGEVVHGRDYWITKTNGLMGERSYNFAEDGHMTNPIQPGEIEMNGLVPGDDGLLYYYENGILT